MSVTPSAGGFPVDVVEVSGVFLVIDLRGVAGFLRDVGTMHLSVILVVVRDNTSQPGVTAVSVRDRTVKGGVGGGFTIIATIELWAVPGVVRGVGYFAVEAPGGSGRAWGGSSGF